MKYSIGDFLDRLSILRLKKERYYVNDEQLRLFEIEYLENYKNLEKYVSELYEINKSIWDLEYDIRMNIEKDLTIIGKKALKIRDINNLRVSLVNKINKETNSGFQEKRNYDKSI